MKCNSQILLLVPLSTLYACSHPIEIVGEGDVLSATGTRSCYLEEFQAGEENCTKNIVQGAYNETYYAVPRDGWQFDHWVNYCTDAINNECAFNIPADAVQKNWGTTVPSLVAVFAKIPAAPPEPPLEDIMTNTPLEIETCTGLERTCAHMLSGSTTTISVTDTTFRADINYLDGGVGRFFATGSWETFDDGSRFAGDVVVDGPLTDQLKFVRDDSVGEWRVYRYATAEPGSAWAEAWEADIGSSSYILEFGGTYTITRREK